MAKAKKKTDQITDRALFQRINRRLAKQNEILKKTRGAGRAYLELGQYYVLNFNHNVIVRKDVELSSFAAELGVVD